jgi:NifU-like protein
LVDILADTRAAMEQERLKNAADASEKGSISFEQMTMVQKIKALDEVLDADVRPMLIMDGGNMEIIDIKENMPYFDVYIRYLGACNGCASGSTGTLYAMESILKQKVDENIRILPI